METIRLYLSCDILYRITEHFVVSPYLVQAAFILTSIENNGQNTTIDCDEFISLTDDDCEYITSDRLEIMADAVLKTLKKAYEKQQSFLYLRTHPGAHGDMKSITNDEKMMFRIAYAYHPFGQHVIAYVDQHRLSAYAVMPDYSCIPVEIVIPVHQPNHQRLCIK